MEYEHCNRPATDELASEINAVIREAERTKAAFTEYVAVFERQIELFADNIIAFWADPE